MPEDTTPEPKDPFEGFGPVAGLEDYGRAITDQDGQPSGSPANFEELRGARHPAGHSVARAAADTAASVDAIRTQFVQIASPSAEMPTDAAAEKPVTQPSPRKPATKPRTRRKGNAS